MKTTPTQLVACADCVEELVAIPNIVDNEERWYKIEGPAKKLANYVKENVHADDEELVTTKFVESFGYVDNAMADSFKRYELANGIRVVFFANKGVVDSTARLWIGNGIQENLRKDMTKGQFRSLVKLLKWEK